MVTRAKKFFLKKNIYTSIFWFQIYNLKSKNTNSKITVLEMLVYFRRVTRGGRGEVSPLLFSKIGKECPNLEKKCPDCGHLWVKFLI